MSQWRAALWAEALKARRSRMPWLTALGFSMAPLAGGFFMVVLKDPAYARSMGLIGAKAQITAGVADWPTYLGLLAQAIAVGGLLVFGLIATWVFGREYADRTAKDLLALPTSRAAIVGAKFAVVIGWCVALAVLVFVLGLGIGLAIGLPNWSNRVALSGASTFFVTAALTIALVTPVAFVASAGRGYLPPMGFVILTLALAQIVAVAGWGAFLPWAVAGLCSSIAGPQGEQANALSFALVMLTAAVGLLATFAWWQYADQVV